MLRITGIGAGAVEYLLRGCDGPQHTSHERELEAADAAELGADRYFAHAMERGEPPGVFFGQGWDALDLSEIVAGREAADDEVRAIFGQLRRPDSTERDPRFIGRRPHTFQPYDERLSKLQAAEPDATPERMRAMEREARAGGTRNVAYYDFTFSPVKSVSVLYAAYLAAGDRDAAQAVRGAHDEAVRIALSYAESQVAFTRRGGTNNRTYEQAEGLAAVLFAHHTSREGEPQLHTHAAVLNRVGTADGHVGALDGKGFRAFKEAIATAYERAVEQLVTEATGLRFELRPDGVAREIVGMDPALLAESSTRRGQITERVRELVAQYRDRHGREPSAAARKTMAQEATYSTRAAKTGLAGPKAVTAWVDRGHERRGRLATALAGVQRVAGQAASPARDAGGPVAAPRERIEAALTAGLADVQAKYATWQLGNLVDAIDRHLGDAAALGVPAAQRAAHLEALARRALDPAEGFGVVQLTAHEPVSVPSSLCRADGRPVWRPHEERRFATATQLGVEADVAGYARREGALVPERAVLPLLEDAGLSVDQEAAVLGIVRSGRHGEVLIGPAGTGKSRTVGALAHAWTETTGGTVYGVATAQIATANLAGDGLTALNTTRFLAQVTPDPVTGIARRPLRGEDLIVVDEASMAGTPHLAAITRAAARVGAKVVYTGDPAQLAAVEAGGLFAHLADTLPATQVHHLAQPHRFHEAWEAEASLWLRDGDPRAVDAYEGQGRLTAGTVEEMTAAARRGWLADRLNGLDAVLVVGSNQTAAQMSGELQAELIDLGRVQPGEIAPLADDNYVHLGDVVEARRNAWGLGVDPSPEGVAEAVMNRGRYTIVGRGEDGTILGRDRHGGVAHLPVEYLAEHAALGYASTVFAAEGISVDASHDVVDRDATREAMYVGLSRGGRHNYAYLVTEREPDAHEPQRLAEVAAERFAAVLEVSGAERSASAVLAADEVERSAAPTLLARLEHAGRAGIEPHLDTVRARLGVALDPEEWSTGRLTAALRAVELAGHDPGEVLDRAIAARGFDDVDSIPDALAHRLRGQLLAADPDRDLGRDPDPARDPEAPETATAREGWTAGLGVRGDPELHGYTRDVATVINARQTELGERVAIENPAWARTLGDRPDPALDPEGEQAWRERAGVTAFYREAAGLDPEQLSLGAPPPRERPVDRALYDAALAAAPAAAPTEPGGRDWRAVADAELYTARERWDRDFAQAPPWVFEEKMATYRLARGYREDAAIEAARAEAMPAGPERDEVAHGATEAARFAEQHEARAAELDAAQLERTRWWEQSEPVRLDAAAAMVELDRRGLPPQRVLDDLSPTTEPIGDQPPEPEPAEHEPAAPDRAAEVGVEAQEVAVEKTPQRAPSRLPSLDREMLIDEEIRGRFRDSLAERHGPQHTRDRDRELDDDLELGW